MPEEISISVPAKLAKFIDKLVEEEFFKSRKDFVRRSSELVAELYGLAQTSNKGKSLLDILVDTGKGQGAPASGTEKASRQSKKTAALTPEELDTLDLFVGTTFEFEDALYARFTMEAMKLGKAPKPKEEFIGLLVSLADKGKIEKGEHNNKTIWKVLEKY